MSFRDLFQVFSLDLGAFFGSFSNSCLQWTSVYFELSCRQLGLLLWVLSEPVASLSLDVKPLFVGFLVFQRRAPHLAHVPDLLEEDRTFWEFLLVPKPLHFAVGVPPAAFLYVAGLPVLANTDRSMEQYKEIDGLLPLRVGPARWLLVWLVFFCGLRYFSQQFNFKL